MSKRHDFEGFMRKTIELNTYWLLQEKNLPQPIDQLHLWSPPGHIEIPAIIVEAGDEIEEIMHGDYPQDTSLPIDDEDDTILADFLKEQDLEESDIYWGDYFGLPECLYRMEMIHCAHAVAENARNNGIQFTPDAAIGIRLDDEDYEDPRVFADIARAELKKLEPETARKLLSLFYSDVEALKLL